MALKDTLNVLITELDEHLRHHNTVSKQAKAFTRKERELCDAINTINILQTKVKELTETIEKLETEANETSLKTKNELTTTATKLQQLQVESQKEINELHKQISEWKNKYMSVQAHPDVIAWNRQQNEAKLKELEKEADELRKQLKENNV